uniref:Uncharacterized protein n=1 Tax=Amphimedon queenslandica TaxID=400682 RepID=A0A1X7TND8_AMPQE
MSNLTNKFCLQVLVFPSLLANGYTLSDTITLPSS